MSKKDAILCHYKFSNQKPVIFGVHKHKLTPGAVFDMHLSPEVGVVLNGKMARYSGDSYSELTSGGVWVTGMLEPHGRQALEPDSSTAVFIISPDFFANTNIPGVDSHIWHLPFNTPAQKRPFLINEEFTVIIGRLLDFINSDVPELFKQVQINFTLLEIILRINQLGKFKALKKNKTTADLRRLQPALQLIFNSSQTVNTDEAASLCKLSSSRFSQLFTSATGQSFSKFSLRHRLSQVAHDLKNTTLSLDELAEKWGFTDKSHLVHRFKEHYKLTPVSYRKV